MWREREGGIQKIRKMSSFKRRVNSFSKLNFSYKFKKLALFGFRYVSQKVVVCHLCYTRCYNFLSLERPEIYHIKQIPDCPVVRQLFGDEMCYSIATANSDENDYKKCICKICHVRKVYCFFIPCYHAMACSHCLIPLRQCPYCKIRIRSIGRLYY